MNTVKSESRNLEQLTITLTPSNNVGYTVHEDGSVSLHFYREVERIDWPSEVFGWEFDNFMHTRLGLHHGEIADLANIVINVVHQKHLAEMIATELSVLPITSQILGD